MSKYSGSDIIGQVAETMLKVCASFVNADTYSFYLYDDLFIPIANYFPGDEFPELNSYPISHETPLVRYMQENRRAVHNQLPEVKDLWEKSTKFDLMQNKNLKYVLAAPLLHDDKWMGSINLARRNAAFNQKELSACENVAKMIVVFFESSEKLFQNNIYLTFDSGKHDGTINLQIHNTRLEQTDGKGKLNQSLTKREQEVLRLLTSGCTYNEIAKKLFISINTVKYHLRNIYRKAGTNSKMRLLHTLYDEEDTL